MDDWTKWSMYVLKGIEEIKADQSLHEKKMQEHVSSINKKLDSIERKIFEKEVEQKTKAAVWGTIGGTVMLIGKIVFDWITRSTP